MATGFDPYHRWLSIPPSEQPPNHYRLLGLQAFESSVEVIQNAAERQSRHVRSHLRSPLGAHAINLIREIEVARLCLIDPEAKCAYDACRMQRAENAAPSISRSAASAAFGRQIALDPGDTEPDPSPAAIVPSIVTKRYGRQKRKSAPIVFVFMWIASGTIGLLAGYAVLCMIGPQYDFLHVMFAEDRGDSARTEYAAISPIAFATTDARQTRRPAAGTENTPQRAHSIQAEPTDPREDQSIPVAIRAEPPRVERRKSKERTPKGNGNAQFVNKLVPIVVPFDFKTRVLRVVSMPEVDSYEEIRCNIQASAELGMNPLIDFPLGGKQDVVFNVGLGGVIAGIEVSFLRRNKAVIVEITPKYRLPSGDEEAWYKTAGIKKANQLSDRVSSATAARRALPGLGSELARATREYESTSVLANMPTTAGALAKQIAAQQRLPILRQQGQALQKQLGIAESLSTNLPKLEADLMAVQRLGEWSGEIAETATLAVCIHRDGVALDAEAR